MESASKLSALAQPFGVRDAIKSWFGLFNLFLKANQIVIAENLHASAFSGIAKSRELLRHQLQVITSSRSTILSSGKEVNNLPFESAGLAGARRADNKQERRHAYRRKRPACLEFSQFKYRPVAVEPRSITSFNDCEPTSSDSPLTDNFVLTSH